MRSRMNPWRLEWLRLTRSPRGLVLLIVYLFFGFTGPLLVKYLNQLAKLGSSGVQIIAPKPLPADGLVNFVSQSSQTGLLVLVVVVAGALSYDAHRGHVVPPRGRGLGRCHRRVAGAGHPARPAPRSGVGRSTPRSGPSVPSPGRSPGEQWR